ncbi:MAG: hypothetical protein JSV99_12380 [Planctomycetota bacterium]|nr:MAG: hypothetical protein JSV99_12380 [Planctomycetota bacterium]
MRKLTVLLTLVMLFPHSGCTFARLVGLVATPTEHEKKIPAEYDLTKRKGQKMLVLVHEPGWLGAQVNLRYYLTEAINENLQRKVRTEPEYLTGYDELSEFRSNHGNFSLLSAVEVGAALDASMVLLVVVEDYQLTKMGETDYYKGFLAARTVLLDVGSGEKLWPKSGESKTVRVGFEIESGGQAAAVRRLAADCAYCTVRYFYDCPKRRFKIADDRSDAAWDGWGK